MKYLMFVVHDPVAASDESAGPTLEEWEAEMSGRGVVSPEGDRLCPPADATTVRIRGGELLVSDGPYLEAKEWVAGFDILDCRDLDEAIEVAAKHPMARRGTIELRPFWTLYDESGRLIDQAEEDDG
jgi:hypothetical protein